MWIVEGDKNAIKPVSLLASDVSSIVSKSIKNTIGYKEAADKGSFLDGASVALRRAEDEYTSLINSHKSSAEYWKQQHDNIRADMNSLTSILNKYG